MENIEYLDQAIEIGVKYGLKIIIAVLILIIGRLISKGISRVINKILKKREVEPTIISFSTSLIYFALLTLVIISAISQLGVQTSSFVAVIGAAGLAVGLALQGSLSNFASGFLILIFHPFRTGDYIEAAGTAGIVDKMHIFTTQLKTPDNRIIIIPNSKLTDDNITNYSANKIRRVDLTAGIGYSDDIDKTKKVLYQILESDDRVLKDPKPMVALTELADSSVNFLVRPWVKTEDYWDFYFEIYEKIKKGFDAENISIPFPQTDVHLFDNK
ncbi:MAG: mechanosensitive ion channel [Candidatus Cloacimonadota bacterium]|nr:mechanosensitive ion channel [Candidatus Cloacimonadota bacterium]